MGGNMVIFNCLGFTYGSRSAKRLRKYHVSAAWQCTMLWGLTSAVAIPSLARLFCVQFSNLKGNVCKIEKKMSQCSVVIGWNETECCLKRNKCPMTL